MKKFFTTCVLLLGLSIFAQEAGRSGELLKNEASQTEMQTQRKEMTTTNSTSDPRKTNDGILANSNTRVPSNNRITKSTRSESNEFYRWKQNFGSSEVFLRIPQDGNFSVEIGDQYIQNYSGKFRFFDLNAGRIPISIYEDGYLVYRTRINIQNNKRLVLDYFTNKGLYLLDSYSVKDQFYGFSDWDDVWNSPYNNDPDQNYYGNVMNNNDFNNFLYSFKKTTSFDNDKINLIQYQIKNTNFTSQQLKDLLQVMSFDKNKLTVAKLGYLKCVDRQNFYIVSEAFDFSSSKNELLKFISSVG